MKRKLPKICLIVGLVFGSLAVMNGWEMLSRLLQSKVYAAAGQKIVTVYDKTRKQTVLTEHKTVAEVLKQADIVLDKFDIVEPGLDVEVSDGFNVNIFRARPLTVVDGDRQVKILTPYQLASDIAKVAGIVLYPEDKVEFKLDSLGLGSDIGSQMVIHRAAEFNLVFFGKKSLVRSHQATVGEFLAKRQIDLNPNDRVSLALQAPIRTGMTLEIWQEGEQERTTEEEIKFTTRQINDFEKPTSFREIRQKGENGRRLVTYKINIKNGQEISKVETHSVITKPSVEQIEVVGSKINLPPGSHQDWMAAAGIAESDWGVVNYLVSRESGWRVNARNKSSGAYGLPQALPGRKMASAGADWETNPITQLRWMQGYVKARYGGWQGAYSFWQKNKWY